MMRAGMPSRGTETAASVTLRVFIGATVAGRAMATTSVSGARCHASTRGVPTTTGRGVSGR